MAKLFKIQAYVLDPNDEFSNESRLEDCLMYCTQNDLFLSHLNIESANLGEWYDEHPLNYVRCHESEFEKYFKENNDD